MSGMEGNPDYVPELMDSPDARSVPTMLGALVHEQRTANLIAFYADIARDPMDRDTRRLRAKIMDRLGLGGAS